LAFLLEVKEKNVFDIFFFSAFFKKHNVGVMSLQALFDFITDPTI